MDSAPRVAALGGRPRPFGSASLRHRRLQRVACRCIKSTLRFQSSTIASSMLLTCCASISRACSCLSVSDRPQEFILKLDSNPTTGYTWMLEDDKTPAGLEFLGCRYTRTQAVGDRPLVGSGGIDSWAFKAVGKGAVHLNLQKVRPWEPRPKQMDAGFTVNIE